MYILIKCRIFETFKNIDKINVNYLCYGELFEFNYYNLFFNYYFLDILNTNISY